jgi:benzodiazapine receptor
MKPFLSLIINIVIPHFGSFIGSFFSVAGIETWYIHLNKPSFNPPNWIFAPVWTILYTLIGVAFYLFHKKDQFKTKKVYILYAFHIFVNAIWSILFFKMHQLELALIDIVLMIVSLIILMKWFYNSNRLSFYLLIPYIAWLCFAFLLSCQILILNS